MKQPQETARGIEVPAELREYFSKHGRWTASYRVENFRHPLIGELTERLNRTSSLAEALDPVELKSTEKVFFDSDYFYPGSQSPQTPTEFRGAAGRVSIEQPDPKLDIDVSSGGPYANYNWELLFHFPLAIAVHLSKSQRYAEAQRWFHLLFDPSRKDGEYWRSFPLRETGAQRQIDRLLKALSEEETGDEVEALIQGYEDLLAKPFRPFAVARTRPLSFKLAVVMRYLDNLLAWGDALFAQDTSESVAEARQIYGQGRTLLGPRPERIPVPMDRAARSYRQLKSRGLDLLGNAMIELEPVFPLGYGVPHGPTNDAGSAPLMGLVRALYFCVPHNDRLLRYWGDFDDRIAKIRAGMNLQGVVRRLALFDPPIDPALLVRAAASGIDIAAAVASISAPMVPVRAQLLLQRALELAAEVRSLGAAVLSAVEKRDGEDLALMRQSHELRLLRAQCGIRLLQWEQAKEATEVLLKSRAATLERYRFYLRLLGQAPDPETVPEDLPLRREALTQSGGLLTEKEFEELYGTLVETYDRPIAELALPELRLASRGNAQTASGAQGSGELYLSRLEHYELNQLLPSAVSTRETSFAISNLASILANFPDFDAKLAFWGIGAQSRVAGGEKMSTALNTIAGILSNTATSKQERAGIVSRTASYQRRADEWTNHANLAARELAQQGRQLIGAIIAEHAARREYENVQEQIEDSEAVQSFLNSKFAGRDLYHWMQGELSRLHRQYFDFAVYTARKAEAAIRHELMRPEVDAQAFIRHDYWSAGRRGMLAGEALHLDLKRMEMAYLENNKYEDPLPKKVSLRRLNPLALLQLQATGRCEFTVPEWLYDLDCPGGYMRRIRRVSVEIPAVTGPYAHILPEVTLLRSSVRVSPAGPEYARQGQDDMRFKDWTGARQVTLNASPSSGTAMEPPSARDQLLPYELHGAESDWRIELPAQIRQFDYRTIPDVILHIDYTARSGGHQLRNEASKSLDDIVKRQALSGLAALLCLPDEFASAWARFVDGGELKIELTRDQFPYFTTGREIKLLDLKTFAIDAEATTLTSGSTLTPGSTVVSSTVPTEVTLGVDPAIKRESGRRAYVLVRYELE